MTDRNEHETPARRGWIAGLTRVPPAGPAWRAGRWPGFLRHALLGLAAALVTALFLLSFGG